MIKKLTAVLLMLCLLLGTALPSAPSSARAESFAVYVSANTVNVYSKASTSSAVLGSMCYGETMLCLAYKNGWAAVQNSAGQIGYCPIAGLTIYNPNTLNKTAYVAVNNTPVYRKPDTSSRVMMLLKQNSSWTAVGVTGDKQWVRLQNGKFYGYVQAGNLSTTAINTSTGTTAAPSLNTPVYVVANTLVAYDRPSTSGRSLGVMSYGEGMLLQATASGWARIQNGYGAVGYCLLSGLSTTNPNTMNQKVYITADGVSVFRKPHTSSGVMMQLKRNSSYTCVAVTQDGLWARLQNGKYYGYVATAYLSNLEVQLPETETSQEKTVYVSANLLPVYSQPDSTAVLGTMSFGEALILMNVDDGWAKVRNSSGTVGYCLYGGITATNPNTLNAAYYTAGDGVKFYARPQTGAAVVKTANVNTSVMVVALSEDALWARVNLGGSYAYVLLSQLSESRSAVDDGSMETIAAKTVYIAATTLPCYALNSTASAVLGTMSFGESLTCTGVGDGWARVVNSSGAVGYCLLSGLTDKNPNSYNVTMYAQSSGVKVYAKASTSSTVLATLNVNSQVTAVAISPDRLWVRLKSGSVYSYAAASALATTQVSSTNTSVAAKVIALAMQQIGIKYVYAAQSPSTGFDCSGLTYYVFKNAAGITLKRTAYTQGYNDNYLKITSVGSLLPGDLVFFNTVGTDADLCDHVGIYIGGSKFIHASSAKGEVTTSEISNGNYYARTFSWGRRVLS